MQYVNLINECQKYINFTLNNHNILQIYFSIGKLNYDVFFVKYENSLGNAC